jgi:ketosteroid isomerase-like protein
VKRQNIELTLGFLDAVRRRDRAAARGFLDPGIVWQGIVPDLICHGSDEVLDIFLAERDRKIEVEGMELIGSEAGAVFAFHRPDVHEVAGVEIQGALHHALTIVDGRITRIEDCPGREEALAAAGIAR